MNSREQTHFDLDKSTGRNELSKSIAGISFFALIAYGVVKTVQYLLRADDVPEDSIPPIIIKSGSFIIESDKQLSESGGTGGNPYVYKRIGFNEIKGVRVFINNEVNGSANSYPYDDPQWVDVDIWFQDYVNGVWQPVTLPINPDVTIRSEGNPGADKDFVLRTKKKLETKEKSHPKRKGKGRDKDNGDFRFARVRVSEKDGGGDTFDADDGCHYMIAFYNSLD
ncbi:MAG: hypothetical protein LC768_14510 [Acidobacteria bacterium]|nr:hypothetical protein [Acidobacteriota bacterium]MCA1639521.1 hypothetical protein [Acidobacteriota bacterium]